MKSEKFIISSLCLRAIVYKYRGCKKKLTGKICSFYCMDSTVSEDTVTGGERIRVVFW